MFFGYHKILRLLVFYWVCSAKPGLYVEDLSVLQNPNIFWLFFKIEIDTLHIQALNLLFLQFQFGFYSSNLFSTEPFLVYTNFNQMPYLQSQRKNESYHFLKVCIWPESELERSSYLDYDNVPVLSFTFGSSAISLSNNKVLCWQSPFGKNSVSKWLFDSSLPGITSSSQTSLWIVANILAIFPLCLVIYFTSLSFLAKAFAHARSKVSEDFTT